MMDIIRTAEKGREGEWATMKRAQLIPIESNGISVNLIYPTRKFLIQVQDHNDDNGLTTMRGGDDSNYQF